ncbi:hypothetical protein [Bordetella pertussis]|uniref:hypothetical protein n=1 Tax=Bordetella pertussis TaxID=520 RepID=UPI0021CB2A48|nr:hypothetical protein [Bordetella pertussis]
MALVLARFGFGFCMLLAALMLLVAATLLATRLVGWAVRAFALERSQALASGVAIFLLVARPIGWRATATCRPRP